MKTLTPLKAIRAKCIDCSADQLSEVRYCSVTDCPIFIYRFGTNPNRKGIGNLNGSFPQSEIDSKQYDITNEGV